MLVNRSNIELYFHYTTMYLHDYVSGVGYGIYAYSYVWMVIFQLPYRYVNMDQVPDRVAAALGVALPRISRAIKKVNILFVHLLSSIFSAM